MTGNRPIKFLNGILILLAMMWSLVGSGFAQTNLVTPAQWLALQPKPQFKPDHTLPRLTRAGWVLDISTNTAVELATHWGYALELELSNSTLSNTINSARGKLFFALANSNPAQYRISVNMNRVWPQPIPDEFWCHGTNGWFVDVKSNYWQYATNNQYTKVQSPEAPAEYLAYAASNQVASLEILAGYAPVAIIQNQGEYGLPVFPSQGQAWRIDPKVLAAKANLTWPRYTSNQKARELGFVAAAVRSKFPNRDFFLYYNTGTEAIREGPGWETYWGWNSDVMVTNSDYPSMESYYQPIEQARWVGKMDHLTRFLNWAGYNQNLGYSNWYNWVCGGWWQSPTNRSPISLYIGFLKCCYTGGMLGANAGYYAMPPEGGFDVPFPESSPPGWLEQNIALARVHAQFSHLENYLRNGDLLSGLQKHKYSFDQPAYEFTNTVADVNARVLARKHRDRAEWLICAWAADGTNRTVTVSIPTLGAVLLLARDCGSVYKATTTNLTLLDPNGLFPTEFPALNPPRNLKVQPPPAQ